MADLAEEPGVASRTPSGLALAEVFGSVVGTTAVAAIAAIAYDRYFGGRPATVSLCLELTVGLYLMVFVVSLSHSRIRVHSESLTTPLARILIGLGTVQGYLVMLCAMLLGSIFLGAAVVTLLFPDRTFDRAWAIILFTILVFLGMLFDFAFLESFVRGQWPVWLTLRFLREQVRARARRFRSLRRAHGAARATLVMGVESGAATFVVGLACAALAIAVAAGIWFATGFGMARLLPWIESLPGRHPSLAPYARLITTGYAVAVVVVPIAVVFLVFRTCWPAWLGLATWRRWREGWLRGWGAPPDER
jgi:hypothetical protein